MKPEEVSRWPAKGQYWAALKPLSLLRMGELRPEDSGAANRWTPESDEDGMCFIFPLAPEHYRYLWNEWRTPYHEQLSFVPGDVWLYVTRTSEQRLFFVGPETTPKEVQILSDHTLHFTLPQNPKLNASAGGDLISVMTYTPDMHLFQPGAGRKVLPAKSFWEHINRDE